MRGLSLLLLLACVAFSKSINVHVYGMAGTGKSTLVSILCAGDFTAVSHQGEGTFNPHVHTNCTSYNWVVVDIPGYGIPRRSSVHSVTIPYDDETITILAIGPRVYTQDVDAFKFLILNTPVIVVRTRCDIFPCDQFALYKTLMAYFGGSMIFGVSKDQEHTKDVLNLIEFIQHLKE